MPKKLSLLKLNFQCINKNLSWLLGNYGMRSDAQSYTPDAHAPSDLYSAYQDYQASRVKLAALVGNPPNHIAVVMVGL